MQICRNQDCLGLKDLAVTGNDLIALGIAPGREIGEALRNLLQLVLEEPAFNTKEELLKICREKYIKT